MEAVELQQELAMLKAELATASTQIASEEDDAAVAATDAARQLAEAHAAVATLEEERHQMNAEVNRCNAEQEDAKRLLAESTATAGEQNAKLKEALTAAETDAGSARLRSETLQTEVDQLKQEVDLLQEIAAEQQQQQQKLLQQAEATATATAADASIGEEVGGVNGGEEEVEDPIVVDLKEELKATREQIEALEAEISFAAVEKSQAVNKIKRELMDMREEFEDLESEKGQIQLACEKQQQKLVGVEQELAAATAAAAEAKLVAVNATEVAATATATAAAVQAQSQAEAEAEAVVSAAAAAAAASVASAAPAPMANTLAEGMRMLISMKGSADVGLAGGEYLSFARGTAIVVSGEPDDDGNFQAVLEGQQGKVPSTCLMDAMDLLDQLTQENTKLQTSAAHADRLREELAQSTTQSVEAIQELETQIAAAESEVVQLRESSEQAGMALAQVRSELEAERSTRDLLQYGNMEHAAKLSTLGERCADLESQLKLSAAAAAQADVLLEEAKASRKDEEDRDWQAMANLTGVVKQTQAALEELKAERQVHISMIQQHSRSIEAFEVMVTAQQKQTSAAAAATAAQTSSQANSSSSSSGGGGGGVGVVGVPFAAEMVTLRGFLDDFSSNVAMLKDKVPDSAHAEGEFGVSVGVGGGSAHAHSLTLESELSRVNRMLAAEQVQSEALAAELHALRQTTSNAGAAAAAAAPSKKKSVSQRRLIREASKAHEKQLRAESFRKALVYQKKYLLLTIGNFKTPEDVTLADISRSGVSQFANQSNGAGRFKFRSVVNAIIAARRMKWLANRWSALAR